MTTINTATRGLILAIALATTLSACATPGGPRPQSGARATAPQVGGDYLVVRRVAHPARDGFEAIPAATWSSGEWDDLARDDTGCRAQMDPYIPGIVQEVFLPSGKLALSTALGGGLGTAVGAVAGFTGVTFGDYLKYGSLAAGGSALGSGLATYADRYELAKSYVQYACMQFQVSEARRFGRLNGIGILPWAGTGDTLPVPRPEGPPAQRDADLDDTATDSTEDSDPPLTPPL